MKLKRLMAALTFAAAGVGAASAFAAIDPALPDYQKTSGVSGNLSSVGSDTLANLMTLWAEEYKRLYPSVNVQIQAAGSSRGRSREAMGGQMSHGRARLAEGRRPDTHIPRKHLGRDTP